jgi:hypothetical protein
MIHAHLARARKEFPNNFYLAKNLWKIWDDLVAFGNLGIWDVGHILNCGDLTGQLYYFSLDFYSEWAINIL